MFDVRIQFLFNILRTNRLTETKFCIHIIFDNIYFGIVKHYFSQLCNKITALDRRQNSVFVQYLECTDRQMDGRTDERQGKNNKSPKPKGGDIIQV